MGMTRSGCCRRVFMLIIYLEAGYLLTLTIRCFLRVLSWSSRGRQLGTIPVLSGMFDSSEDLSLSSPGTVLLYYSELVSEVCIILCFSRPSLLFVLSFTIYGPRSKYFLYFARPPPLLVVSLFFLCFSRPLLFY